MDIINDKNGPSEEYWNDGFPERNTRPRRLINGINVKDLCDGKEVIFEMSKDGDEYDLEDEEISEDITQYDSTTLREKRGAPPLNTSFKEMSSKMTNVTDDGLVKKQIITSGSGKVVPDHAYVTVHYNLYKESCELPFDSTYMRNHPIKFRLDQGEAILGLEYAIKTMKKNENSMFFIKWEVAFGALGCPDRIEPECDIVADITLINFLEIDPEYELASGNESDKIDFSKYLNKVKQFLCNGSDEFTKGETKAAIIYYKKALKILNSLRLSNEIEEKQMLEKKMKCLVNLAVCYNKLGRPEQSCLVCQEALSIDAKNVKANFHYGRANIALSNFPLAKQYLLRADKLKPNDKEINMEIKKLNDKKALYELKDKMFWTKALGGEEKKENPKEDVPSSLKNFEKSLINNLKECIKEEKPYILPMPLLDEEMKICERVAEDMKMEFETQPHFCVFKNRKNTKNVSN